MFHLQMGGQGPSACSKHSHSSLPVTPPQPWVGLAPRQQAQGGGGLPTLGLRLPACAPSSVGPPGVSSLSAWWWWWARCLGGILSESGEGRGKGPRGEASPSLEGTGPAPAPAGPSPLMGGAANQGHRNTASGPPGPCRALGVCWERGPRCFSSPLRWFHFMDRKTEAYGTW